MAEQQRSAIHPRIHVSIYPPMLHDHRMRVTRPTSICSLLLQLSHSTHQMWVLHLFHHRDIVQLDVEVLVDALQCAAYRNVVLELDGDFMVHQCLEEAAWYRKIWLARAPRYTYAYALVLVRGVGPGLWPSMCERGRSWSWTGLALEHRTINLITYLKNSILVVL
jgi:hypothetical protein